jgi:hypothetical protein
MMSVPSANPSRLVKDRRSAGGGRWINECVDEIYLGCAGHGIKGDIFRDAQRGCACERVAKNQLANECLELSHMVQVVAPLAIMSWTISM